MAAKLTGYNCKSCNGYNDILSHPCIYCNVYNSAVPTETIEYIRLKRLGEFWHMTNEDRIAGEVPSTTQVGEEK